MIKIKDKYKKYYLQNKVELVYRTGILEGLATSRLETEEIIKKGRSLGEFYENPKEKEYEFIKYLRQYYLKKVSI